MRQNTAHIWRRPPKDIDAWIGNCLQAACRMTAGNIDVYFRADDVGVPGKRIERLIRLFMKHRIPLALAVVPAWLTQRRWQVLYEISRPFSALMCWHQHGWRHVNHETSGKKQEFGARRSMSAVRADVIKGRNRLTAIMAQSFFPLFTPPWNRCSHHTLMVLKDKGYRAVSRFQGAEPAAPNGMADLRLNVDMHTRKDPDAKSGWEGLFNDLRLGIASGRCGIMIHHRYMNPAAFTFLDCLLAQMKQSSRFRLVGIQELIP